MTGPFVAQGDPRYAAGGELTAEMLRITDLYALYGESHILHGIDLTVNEAELLTLTGSYLIILVFAVVVVGGMGSVLGAIVIGLGFIEETGASQHLRDARITTIYEGTTGPQANDLIGHKLARDEGAA